MPAFAIPYAPTFDKGRKLFIEAILIITPPLFSAICLPKTKLGITVPMVLTSITLWKTSMLRLKKPFTSVSSCNSFSSNSVILVNASIWLPPAPLISTWHLPYFSKIFLAASFTESSFETSQLTENASPPEALISFSTACNFSMVLPKSATLYPSLASSLAISEHKVPPAPVTTAIFLSLFVMLFCLYFKKLFCIAVAHCGNQLIQQILVIWHAACLYPFS